MVREGVGVLALTRMTLHDIEEQLAVRFQIENLNFKQSSANSRIPPNGDPLNDVNNGVRN